MPMMFFYFLKIIFDISTSKRSKKYKPYSILAKKKFWNSVKNRFNRRTKQPIERKAYSIQIGGCIYYSSNCSERVKRKIKSDFYKRENQFLFCFKINIIFKVFFFSLKKNATVEQIMVIDFEWNRIIVG
jgi:hypothetical protein